MSPGGGCQLQRDQKIGEKSLAGRTCGITVEVKARGMTSGDEK